MKPVDFSLKSVLARLGLTNEALVYMQESIWNNIEYEEDRVCKKWMCQDLYTAALLELSDLEKAGAVARHQGPNNIVMFTYPWPQFMRGFKENCDLMLMHKPGGAD